MPQADSRTSTCTAAALAKPIADLIAQIAKADAKHLREDSSAADRTGQWLEDRLSMLADAASHQQATSPLGALLQVRLLHREAELIGDDDPEAERRIRRLLYSIGEFLCDEFGLPRDDEAGGYFMPVRGNPHIGVRAFAERA